MAMLTVVGGRGCREKNLPSEKRKKGGDVVERLSIAQMGPFITSRTISKGDWGSPKGGVGPNPIESWKKIKLTGTGKLVEVSFFIRLGKERGRDERDARENGDTEKKTNATGGIRADLLE